MEFANDHIDNTFDLFAKIDGVSVALNVYRVQSPLFVWGPLPEDNIFEAFGLNAPTGTTSPAVDVGYYLLLTPLSVGKHKIQFGGEFGGVLSGFVDATYHITVAPR